MGRAHLLRIAFKTLMALGLLLLFAQLLYGLAVRRYVDGLAATVAPTLALSYERLDIFPPGRLGLRDVRLEVVGQPALSLHADRLALRTEDRAWLITWLLGRNDGPGRDLGLHLDGVTVSAALLAHWRERAGPVGLTLPFEGVGCGNGNDVLTADDYARLGWAAGRWNLSLRLHHQPIDRRMDLDWRIDREPPAVLRGSAIVLDVPSTGLPLRSDLGGARIERLEIRYDELGALSQRNRHCGQGNNGFIERHRQRLHAWLGTLGLVPDEPVWAAYGQWLEHGGELELIARPARAIGFEDYHQFAPEDRLRLLSLGLRVGDQPAVPVEAVASGVLIAADFSPLPDLPGEPVDFDQTFEAEAEPSDWSDWPAPDQAAEPVQAVAEQEPEETAPAPPRPQLVYRAIEFDDLVDRRGDRVRVTTLGGNRHNGIVLAATADALELQITRYGGGARLPIAREQIARIERMHVE